LPRTPRVAVDHAPLEQPIERFLYGAELGEAMQSLTALLQLAGGLRSPQHQHRQQRQLLIPNAKRLWQQLPVLAGAAAGPAGKPGPATLRESAKRLADPRLVVLDDGVAVGRLVTGEAERVQRERVRVGRGALLLDQTSDHPDLDGVGVHQPRSGR